MENICEFFASDGKVREIFASDGKICEFFASDGKINKNGIITI
jgi:hypothetical protein